MHQRSIYPCDLTDKEWEFLKPLIPGESKLGRPLRYAKREILNAILYLVRSGCAWRMLPHDLPPWRITYYYFMKWKQQGIWQKIHDHLRDLVRLKAGKKKPRPLRLLTVKALKLLTTEECVDMMQARNLWGGNGTYSWIHSD